jgi:hypothetical protein
MQNVLSPTIRTAIDDLRSKRKSVVSEWMLFLIHPVSALVLAFGNFRSSYAKNILWIFVVFYGFTMVISDEGMDANRYIDNLAALTSSKVTAKDFVDLLYQEETNYVDAAQPLITFLVSRLTMDPRILFATFGLVFGFFYSRNIWFLLERAGPSIKRSSLIIIFVFTIIVGFWQINGFRMWTAAHLFFFGAIQYLIDNKKSGIAIAAMSIFFHYSFIFPTALLLVFMVLPKKAPWFYWIFVITFFISEVNIPILTDKLTSILPGVFHQRIEGYTSDVYIEAVGVDVATRNWRYSFYSQSIKWVATGFLSVIYFFGMRFIKENKNFNTLFCFALVFIASVNMLSNIPSMSRFYSVAYLFIFAFLFLYLQHAPDFRLKKFILVITFPLLIFYSLGMINISFMTIGLVTIFGNPIFALLPFGAVDNAIISFLK